MKRIGFFTNTDKDSDMAITHELIDFVQKLGHETTQDDIFDAVDFTVVLGGDGTMLRAASHCTSHPVPLLGINLGNVGYLTDVEKSQAKNAIQRVLSGNYLVEDRMMLAVNVDGHQTFALNDIVVHRGAGARMVECAVSVDGEHVDTLRADGLIIATPTGSTAYNFAAGGPVLKPDAHMVILTPICPQSPSARSVVVSVNDSVCIHILHGTKATISFDGVNVETPQVAHIQDDGFSINISPNDARARIIKTNNLGFYEILRMKMKKV